MRLKMKRSDCGNLHHEVTRTDNSFLHTHTCENAIALHNYGFLSIPQDISIIDWYVCLLQMSGESLHDESFDPKS